MLKWKAVAAVVLALAAAPGLAHAQSARVHFPLNETRLTPELRQQLDQLAVEARELGDLAVTGHADPTEADVAAALVAAHRAEAIGRLLAVENEAATRPMEDPGPYLRISDAYFMPNSHVLSDEGRQLLDRHIADARRFRPYVVFIHPQFGAERLERLRADAMVEALIDRGAIWIKADGDDFAPGEIEVSEALRAEVEAFRPTVTQAVVIALALETDLQEGPAALTTLARVRAERVRDYLTAGGVPYGRLRIYSAGAADPANDPAANAWVDLVVSPSGW